MRRATIAAAVLALAAPLVPSSASAATVPAYHYRVCHAYTVPAAQGVVCLAATIRRQDDGTGTVVEQVHTVAYTRTSRGAFVENCGNAFETNAVDTQYLLVEGRHKDGAYSGHDWKRNGPDLTTGNGCSSIRRPFYRVNAHGTIVTFSERAHLNLALDQNADLQVVVTNKSWYCAGDFTYCGRS